MNYCTGFFQDDFSIYYRKYESELPIEYETDDTIDGNSNYYKMFYVFEGDFDYICGSAKISMKKNSMFIDAPNSHTRFVRTSSAKFEYLLFRFRTSILPSNIGDTDFLRAFHNLPDTEKMIFSENLADDSVPRLMTSVKKCILGHYGRVHVLSRFLTIISVICMYYDDNFSFEPISSDNIIVRIMQYIDVHYCENINMTTIEEKFFVSSTTLNTIVKNNTGMTFWNYVTHLRLTNAHNLILSGKFSAQKSAIMSGFNYYSTFYRAYCKKYGISPSDDLKRANKAGKWPLTK